MGIRVFFPEMQENYFSCQLPWRRAVLPGPDAMNFRSLLVGIIWQSREALHHLHPKPASLGAKIKRSCRTSGDRSAMDATTVN
jgi:hypothetical protein